MVFSTCSQLVGYSWGFWVSVAWCKYWSLERLREKSKRDLFRSLLHYYIHRHFRHTIIYCVWDTLPSNVRALHGEYPHNFPAHFTLIGPFLWYWESFSVLVLVDCSALGENRLITRTLLSKLNEKPFFGRGFLYLEG